MSLVFLRDSSDRFDSASMSLAFLRDSSDLRRNSAILSSLAFGANGLKGAPLLFLLPGTFSLRWRPCEERSRFPSGRLMLNPHLFFR